MNIKLVKITHFNGVNFSKETCDRLLGLRSLRSKDNELIKRETDKVFKFN